MWGGCSGFNVGVTGVGVDCEVFLWVEFGMGLFRMWVTEILILRQRIFS